jgi:hypothetical protein
MLILNSGTSKVQINLEKDAYMPTEVMGLLATIDNSTCDKDLKQMKIKLFRSIYSVSANGT